MYSQDAAVRLFQRALRMNPQQVSFYSRIAPGAAGNFDGPYTLYRATYKDKKRDSLSEGALKKEIVEWTFYSLDLAQASAPNPKIDDRFQDPTGRYWTIKVVHTEIMDTCFVMECLQELPTDSPIN